MTEHPRSIQIWTPRGADWVRPPPGPFGDHYNAVPTLYPRRTEKRLVLVGESVAAGYLYAPHFTPAKAIANLLPRFDVIDLARTNESLRSLHETVDAAMQLEPDVVVLWAGNNWMLRDFAHLSPYHPNCKVRRDLADALTDHGLGGIDGATEGWVRPAILSVLTEITRVVGHSGARLIVVVPEVNLIDWEHGQPVTVLPEGQESAWHRARQALDHRAMASLDSGSNATTHRFAATQVGRPTNLALLRREVAASSGPLRGTTSSPMATQQIQDLLREWASDHSLVTVDVPALIQASGDRPDRSWFLDYCHHTSTAIQTIARSVANAVGIDQDAVPAAVPAELEAVATLGALMHTDHRLVMAGDRRPLLAHWRGVAERASPKAQDLMRDLIDSRLGATPIPLTAAQRRNRARPFPFGFAHGWRPHTTEADALWALGMTAADSQRRVLSAERAWPNAVMWKPGEQLWHEEQPNSRACGFLRSIVPQSHFGIVVPNQGPIQISLCARLPRRGAIRLELGAWSTELLTEATWTTHRLTIPAAAAEPGLHALVITWPDLAEGNQRWDNALADLTANRPAQLHPVVGEVFSLCIA